MSITSRTCSRIKRHARLRKKVHGTIERPRLQIHRTLHHIYAFIVDDGKGHTLAAASTRERGEASALSSRTNIAAAAFVGKAIARKAKAAGVTTVVFDTSGLKYHGRVAALADAAREEGLVF